MDKISLTYVIAAIAGFSVKELFSFFKSDTKKQTEAILQNTISNMELKVELTHLKEALVALPKMQSDISEAHTKIREILALRNCKVKGDSFGT